MTKEKEYYVQGMEDMLTSVRVAFELRGSIDREDLESFREMIENYKKLQLNK